LPKFAGPSICPSTGFFSAHLLLRGAGGRPIFVN
jgi:hypothetical protein